jgi:hypothetical protein
MLCGIAMSAVTNDDVGGVGFVLQIFLPMTRLATPLPWLGRAKLVRHSWIWIPKLSSPS